MTRELARFLAKPIFAALTAVQILSAVTPPYHAFRIVTTCMWCLTAGYWWRRLP